MTESRFNLEPRKTEMVVRSTPALRTILDYFEKNLKKGYKMDDLKFMLISQGYPKVDVDEAVKIIIEKNKQQAEIEKPKIKVINPVRQIEYSSDMQAVNEKKKGLWDKLFG